MPMIKTTSKNMNNVTKNIMNALAELFRAPTAEEMAAKELEAAKRELLNMLTAQDYSRQMVEYHLNRIKRLTAYIKDNQNEKV